MGMKLMKCKKGVFFTIIAMLIVAVIVAASTPKSQLVYKDRLSSAQSRIDTANGFSETLRAAYMPTALSTSSYSALNSLSEYVKVRGSLFADETELSKAFSEMLMNGTVECSPGSHQTVEECICGLQPGYEGCASGSITLMKKSNLTQRIRDVEKAAKDTLQLETNISKDYGKFDVRLFQNDETGPFQVGVNITINYSVNADIAWWNGTDNITAIFGIGGIEDPMYSVKTRGAAQLAADEFYTNKINESNITSWNVSSVFRLADSRRYKHDEQAPSFLNRFTLSEKASACCGIESLINPTSLPKLFDADGNGGTSGEARAYADWCFLGARCPPETAGALWKVSCVSKTTAGQKFYNLTLDSYHASSYNLTGSEVPTDYIYSGDADPHAAECDQLMQEVCAIDPDTPCIP